MTKTAKTAVSLLALFLIVGLTACGGGSSSTPPPPQAPTLSSITVTGGSSSVLAGATVQLKATGTYSDSTTKDLTATATWSSSDTSIATVSATGMATGVKSGAVTIKATSGTVAGSMGLTVDAPTITSITITPPSSTAVPLGATLQLAATGTFNNSTSGDVTSQVTWASSNDAVIHVDSASGLATATASSGTADITATSGSVTSAALTLSAAAAAPKTLMIVPSSPSLAVLQWIEPSAYLVYTDNSVQDVSPFTPFTVADSSVANLSSPYLGVVTGDSPGTTTINATYKGLTAQANVTVSGTLKSLSIAPKNGTLHPGGELILQGTGTFDTGATETPLIAVFWNSSDPTIASFTQGLGGLLTGKSPGTVTITGKSNVGALNLTDTATATVDDLAFQSFTVTPSTLDMAINVTEQLKATATFSNGSATDTQDLTNVTWTSSDEAVATVDSTGLVRSLSPGTAIITAALPGGQQQTATVVAAHKTFDHIAITSDNTSPKAGDDVQFKATLFVQEGFSYDVTPTAIWLSSDPTVALIDAWGEMHALKAGTVTITTIFGHTVTTPVTIAP
jgi:uncharacterized protein YjdB